MAIEGPTLTVFMARLPDATYNLAAYGVAIALAMFIESPVINLLSASVALARDRAAEERLRAFMWRINILVTLGMIVLCLPFVFDVVARTIIGLEPEIAWRLHLGLLILIPWPAAIGVRRFYQGLMIRNNQTRNVAIGTVVRLLSMLLAAAVLYTLGTVDGIVLGATGLSVGVVCEALATRWMARDVVRLYREQSINSCEPPPSHQKIRQFYTPLMITSAVGFIVMPILSLFIAKAPNPVESLAVVPVVNAFVFLFRSFGFSYQEVGIAYLGSSPDSYPAINRVAWWITIISTLALLVIAVTPLLSVVFHGIFGLPEHLVGVAFVPILLQLTMPATAALFSVQRSVLITAHRTVHVSASAVLEVGITTIVMAILVGVTSWSGVLSASMATAVGRVAGSMYTTVVAGRVREPVARIFTS